MSDDTDKGTLPGYLQTDANCNPEAILNIRNEFLKLQRINNMPIRFDTISPYTGVSTTETGSVIDNITPEKIAMRRKYEILQYKKNSSSASTLSKIKKFNQIVNGPFQRKTKNVTETVPILNENGLIIGYRDVNTIFNIGDCPDDKFVPTLTSSSDVPGPIIELKLDESIPLYNYSFNTNNFASIVEEEEIIPYKFFVSSNIECVSNIENTLFTLLINKVDSNSNFNNFNFTFPIGIFLRGTANNITSNPISSSISITQMSMQVYFDEQLVPNSSTGTYNYSNQFSANLVQNFTNINTVFEVPANLSDNFSIYQFLGNININNLRLPTQNGFVYKIKFNFIVSTNSFNSSYFSNLTSGVFMNTNITNDISTNVNLTPLSSPPTIIQFQIDNDLNLGYKYYLNEGLVS